MNLAKVSVDGQITVPKEIRESKSGDKTQAIYKAQEDFQGVAEEIGVYSDEDVQNLVNEVRYGKDK